MFDRNKKYYKIFNEVDCHRGFQYKDGLNIDTIPFNDDPKKSCVKGGFYFSDDKNICKFLSYGTHMREVEIPEDANVIKVPDSDKWRSDRLLLHERKDLRKLETWEWMVKEDIDIEVSLDYVLSWAILQDYAYISNYFGIFKYLYKVGRYYDSYYYIKEYVFEHMKQFTRNVKQFEREYIGEFIVNEPNPKKENKC